MKTLTNHAGEIKRVSDDKADKEVKHGWKFAPKHVWKKSVRDINKRAEKVEETAVDASSEKPKVHPKKKHGEI